jgi:hypothetical protein
MHPLTDEFLMAHAFAPGQQRDTFNHLLSM